MKVNFLVGARKAHSLAALRDLLCANSVVLHKFPGTTSTTSQFRVLPMTSRGQMVVAERAADDSTSVTYPQRQKGAYQSQEREQKQHDK